MKKEIEYLNEKLENVNITISHYDKELTISENKENTKFYSELLDQLHTEKELIGNIIKVVGEYYI